MCIRDRSETHDAPGPSAPAWAAAKDEMRAALQQSLGVGVMEQQRMLRELLRDIHSEMTHIP